MSTTNTQKGTSQTTNTFTRQPRASSPDIDTLRGTQFGVDPTIGARVGGAIRRNQSAFNNPAGSYSTPAMREAVGRSQERELMQEGGQQFRQGQFDVNNQTFQKNAYLANLTAPPLVQTGQSGTQTGAQKTPFSAKILPMLAGAGQAGAALSGGGG